MRKIICLGNSILGLKKGELYIGNLIFKRISVCERYIPSEDSIVMILNDLGSDENRRKFCFANNKIVEKMDRIFNPEKYVANCTDSKEIKSLELRIESMQRLKRAAAIVESKPFGKQRIRNLELEIASLIQNQKKVETSEILQRHQDKILAHGIFFSMIWQSRAVVKWFNFMLGNDRGLKDAQKIRKLFSKLHKIRLGKTPRNGFKIGEIQDYIEDNSSLKKYPEYEEALAIFNSFGVTTTHISQTDDEMKKIKTSRLDLVKRLASSQEGKKMGYRPIKCCICKEYTFVKRDSKSKTCTLEKCEEKYKKKYSADTTRKSRLQQHAVNEKKKRSSEKVTTQWIRVDNTMRWCVGVCAKRRFVDKHRICQQCYDDGFST
jgi:hypothetical protein